MDKFLKRDAAGNWNTIPPVPDDKIQNVNCHKFVLYVIGRISWEEMISDAQKESGIDFTFGEQARNISDIPYALVKNFESLYLLANTNCKSGESYIGQILDAETGEMAHSFIIEKQPNGKYTCFDKIGFKYPFSIHELGTMLDFVNKDGIKSYQNQKWRFVPLKARK